MAEELDDGEFWLPSHFLTDADILMDFDFSASKLGSSATASSASDLDFTSGCTETESDEEEILLTGLTGLTHKMTRSNLEEESSCPVHPKGYVFSTSPQSTLCGCMCNQSPSRESGSGPESPPQQPPQAEDENNTADDDKNNNAADNKKNSNNKKNDNATLDLLNKAAGEVARLKMRTEKSSGTGFFDCSQKGVSYPPPLKNLEQFPPLYFQPQFLHFPPMFWAPPNGMQYNQPKPQPPPQNRATKKNNKNNNNHNSNNNNSNRPLGLPLSAWPPLQAQAQAQAQAQTQTQTQAQPQAKVQAQAQPIPPMFVGPKRECTGTGVFLPRRVATPANETRKKSDGNTTKSKSGKGSQSQSKRNSGKTSSSTTAAATTTVNHNDIQLPQEWIY